MVLIFHQMYLVPIREVQQLVLILHQRYLVPIREVQHGSNIIPEVFSSY